MAITGIKLCDNRNYNNNNNNEEEEEEEEEEEAVQMGDSATRGRIVNE